MKVLVGVLTAVFVALYPLAVWFGLTHLSARAVSLWVLALVVPTLVYRFRRAKREDVWAVLRIPLMIAVVVSAGALFDDQRFVLATPVLVNLALLLTFGASLRGVPVIERIARVHVKEEEFDERRIAHCRQVTWAWVVFFGFNASVAAALGWDPTHVDAWAAYNGGIVYALMGVMFAGEYVLRQYRFRHYGGGLHDRLLSLLFPPREGKG